MKYIGENAITKLISLIKGDLAAKQDSITATGVLERDTTGVINGVETVGATLVETQEAKLVDVPNGLLKGDGTTISAAVAGTDYVNSNQAIRYDAAQNLTDAQKAQARGNIGASDNSYTGGRKQNGTLVTVSFTTQGWYRIATGTYRSGGILTVQHHYGNGGPSSLKLLVSMNGYGNAIKCIEYTDYESSGITNVRMVANTSDQYFIDVYYEFNGINYGAIDFISTGRVEATVQEPVYIAADDTLPGGETLLTTMEYLNPPMQLGVEYRTTERYLGKPVYVKSVSVSSFPLGGFANRIQVNTGIPSADVDTVVRWGGFGNDGGNDIIGLPVMFGNDNKINISGYLYKQTSLVAYIQSTGTDFSAYSGTLWLAYTKTTN